MKYSYITTAIPLLLLGSMAANAASSSTEFKVSGELNSKSLCDVIAGNGGVIELGKIQASAVREIETGLPSTIMDFEIKCSEKTQVSFQLIDNKAGTSGRDGPQNYGLGYINGTGKLGFYTMLAYEGSVDGIQQNLFSSETPTSASSSSPSVTITQGMYHGWVHYNTAVASGNNFKLKFMINPSLSSKDKMNGPLTEGAQLDGSATMNLLYGI